MIEIPTSLAVFISYAHEDEQFRQKLEQHLSNLKRRGFISSWHDRNINAGEEWENNIRVNLDKAKIILLLISPAFISSDYCYDKEMLIALKKHNNREAQVIPIIIRPVDWKGAPFGKIQALPKDAKAVALWSDQDEAFVNIVDGIQRVITNYWLAEAEEQFLIQSDEQALAAYEHVIHLEPNNASAYYYKSLIYKRLAHDAHEKAEKFGYDKESTECFDISKFALDVLVDLYDTVRKGIIVDIDMIERIAGYFRKVDIHKGLEFKIDFDAARASKVLYQRAKKLESELRISNSKDEEI